jgi:hypothetical protein
VDIKDEESWVTGQSRNLRGSESLRVHATVNFSFIPDEQTKNIGNS